MNSIIKKILIGIAAILLIFAAVEIGYFIYDEVYRIYNAAVDDATNRIKAGVREGVTEGVGQGLKGALNPLKLPGKIFGRN